MNSMRLYSVWLLAALLPLSGAGWSAEEDVVSELRGPLFEQATKTLREANGERAALLAPTDYRTGATAYRKASEAVLAENGSLETIKRELERAVEAFAAATAQATIAGERFLKVLEARDDAANAEAERVANDLWRPADVALYEAAVALEKGREGTADRQASTALEGFRTAELEAIKNNYLSGTRTLLEEAEDRRAKRYAPESLSRAEEQLATAERLLNEDRYDTDQARSLAQAAQHSARHAIYVATAAEELRRKRTTLEAVLAEWESAIVRVAEQLDLAVHFDNGPDQALASVQGAVVDLQGRLRLQDNLVAEQTEQLNALRDQLEAVSEQLGDRSAAAERLNRLLAEQEVARQRFAEIEASFTVEEATVLRKGSTVIIRLIGLTFDSGSATLKENHPALLDKLTTALARFPNASMVVEGHTDAFGSDAVNLDLSQRRADAVKDYLTTASALAAERITALGYGEAQPLANNETAEGRRRNRRIDVVIYP